MDLSIAKRTIIVILLFLNIFLFFFNYKESKKFNLLQSKVNYITKILLDKKIFLDTEIPRDYYPLKRIIVNPINIQRDYVIKNFFDNEDIKISVEFDKNIIKSDLKSINYYNNRIDIEYNQYEYKIDSFNFNEANKIASKFISDIEGDSNRYSLINIISSNDEYDLTYCEKYKGKYIYPSRYNIIVDNNGIKNVYIEVCDIEGYFGEKTEIYSADEALFSFSDNIKNFSDYTNVYKIEIVYDYPNDNMPKNDISFKLIPHYYIYTENINTPYRINAYTNKLK